MLFPFQKEGVKFLMQEPHRGLFDDMGLGKTIQALSAAAELGCCSILVICPAIIKDTWAKHIEDWTTFDSRSIQILRTKSDTVSDKRVIIVNYELLYTSKGKNDLLKQLFKRRFALC